LWALDRPPKIVGDALYCTSRVVGRWLRQLLAALDVDRGDVVPVGVVTRRSWEVLGNDISVPLEAAEFACSLAGLPPYRHVALRFIDLDEEIDCSTDDATILGIAGDIARASPGVQAYRKSYRWIGGLQDLDLASRPPPTEVIQPRAGYLITSGLDGFSGTLAKYLAESGAAKLAIMDELQLPPLHEWDNWLAEHPDDLGISCRIRRVRELEALGAEVMVAHAALSDCAATASVVAEIEARFGTPLSVIHLPRPLPAALADDGLDRAGAQQQQRMAQLKTLRTLVGRPLLVLSSLVIPGECQSRPNVAALVREAEATMLRGAFGKLVSIAWEDDEECGDIDPTRCQSILRAVARALAAPEPELLVHHRAGAAGASAAVRELAHDSEEPFAQQRHPRPRLNEPYEAPESNVEQVIAELWQEALNIDRIGRHDDFFALGGHSLLAIQMLQQLGSTMQIELSPRDLFRAPTVNALALVVESAVITEIEKASCDDVVPSGPMPLQAE
jgi:acyl carrier protein